MIWFLIFAALIIALIVIDGHRKAVEASEAKLRA